MLVTCGRACPRDVELPCLASVDPSFTVYLNVAYHFGTHIADLSSVEF